MGETQKVSQAFVEEEEDPGRVSEPRPVEAAVQTETANLVVERREEVGVRPPGPQFHEEYEEEGDFQRDSGPVLILEAVDGTEIFGKKAVLPPKPVLSLATTNVTVVHPPVTSRAALAVVPLQSFSIHSRRRELKIAQGPMLSIVPDETGLLEPFFSLASAIQLFEVLTRDRPTRPEKSLLFQQVRTERLPPACVFPM